MNVLEAELGSCSKAKTACCAATKALVVLMVKSRLKSANGSESGFFTSFRVAPAAFGNKIYQQKFDNMSFVAIILTIVNYHAWDTQQCFNFGKCTDDGIWI